MMDIELRNEINARLKPCPMCGGHAGIQDDDATYGIYCGQCGLMVGRYRAAEAISAWNSRIDSKLTAPIRDGHFDKYALAIARGLVQHDHSKAPAIAHALIQAADEVDRLTKRVAELERDLRELLGARPANPINGADA